MVFGTFGQGGYVVDRRMGNAESLRDHLGLETLREVEMVWGKLSAAREAIREAEHRALNEAAAALKNDPVHSTHNVNALIYQKLSGRWMGPVGWLVAIWARLLIVAGGIMTAMRFGRPLRGVLDTSRYLKQFKDPSATEMRPSGYISPDTAQRSYRLVILQHWPDIAESLVECRFDPSVRKSGDALPEDSALAADLTAIWRQCLDATVEASSRRLSSGLVQLIFNLPAVGILAHVGWTTAREYFTGNYLPSNYFIHAGLTIVIALFLSFFVFQTIVRLAGNSERIVDTAVETARNQVAHLHPLTRSTVARQVDSVLQLVPAPPDAGRRRP
jgi:hypothetical protein